jgi:hypothetical protein
MATKPGQTRWQSFVENLLAQQKLMMKSNPVTALPVFGLDVQGAIKNYANEVPVPLGTPQAKTQKATPLSFEAPAAAAPAAPKGQQTAALDPAAIFSQALGGPVTVTSGYRDPQKNASVGGVSGSDHTKKGSDGAPMAWDIVPPPGVSTTEAAKILAAQGFGTIDEGDHVHVSRNPTQVARGALQGDSQRGFMSLAPSVVPGDTANAPSVVAPSPSVLAGMIPDPRLMPGIDLPDAPQRELPPDLPMLELLDKAGLLGPMAEAAKVKPRDAKFDKWDRIAGMLSSAAGAAAGVSPWAGTGQFLLAAGAGAGSGFRNVKKEQQAEILAQEELQRELALMLAKAGLDVDLKNVDVRNTNKDRGYKSQVQKQDVTFQNATTADNRSVEEMLKNAGILQQNLESMNSTDRTRANVAIQGMQQLAGAQNRANEQQTSLNVANANRQVTQANKADDVLDAELQKVGIDPKSKDPLVTNARQTYLAAEAKNPAMAMAGLGQELVLSGNYKDVLGDKDAQAVETAIRQKNVEGAAQIVTSALVANMESNPDAVLKLIDELAALGLPSATIISKKRKRSAAPATAK